jgi:MFS family permease
MGMRKRGRTDDRWYSSFFPFNVAGGSTSPMIPLFVTEALKGTVAQVGLVSAISSIASVPANIIWGNLSDTTKKRKIFVLIGFFGLALALFLMGISMDMGTYYFANFVLGAVAAAAAPVGTVLILESFAKEEWAKRLGDFSKVTGVGWVAGLILGTVWLQLADEAGAMVMAMRGLFILASALCVVSIVLAIRWVPEPTKKLERKDFDDVSTARVIHFERGRYAPMKVLHIISLGAKNLSPVNFPLNLKAYYVVTLLAFSGFLTFYVGFPIFLSQQLGLSVSEVFVVYVASSLTSAFTYTLAGRWTSEVGGKKVQMMAFSGRIVLFPSVAIVGMFDLTLLPLLIIICILHALIGFCWANLSVAGNTLVSNMAFKEHRTESLGAYNSIQGIGAILGSLIGGFVASSFGYLSTFLVASGFVVAALLLLIVVNVEKAPQEIRATRPSKS